MRKNSLRVIAPLAGILIAGSACRKKTQLPAELSLSAPERAIAPSASRETTNAVVPAEIEVKASSGPVELSLALYKTKVETRYPLFRVRLRNIGKEKIRVLSEPFTHPYLIQDRSDENTTGAYLEVLNSADKAPWLRRGDDMPMSGGFPSSNLTDKDRAEIEAWEKHGIKGENLSLKVTELLSRNHPHDLTAPPAFWMEAGASTATTAWVSHDTSDPEQKPIGDFVQLSRYSLPPGKYRMRAVYDEYSTPEYYKKNLISPDAWEVRIKTPFINFEVLP